MFPSGTRAGMRDGLFCAVLLLKVLPAVLGADNALLLAGLIVEVGVFDRGGGAFLTVPDFDAVADAAGLRGTMVVVVVDAAGIEGVLDLALGLGAADSRSDSNTSR